MMLHQNFKQIKSANRFFVLPARNSPKENSGASGGFLPKPLLLRLRHPSSKKISRVFCEILSPKNSFGKTESALVPPPARILGGQNPERKTPFPFSKEIPPPPHQESKEHFSLVLPSEARRWRDDSFHIGILLEKSSDFVQETQPSFRIRFF